MAPAFKSSLAKKRQRRPQVAPSPGGPLRSGAVLSAPKESRREKPNARGGRHSTLAAKTSGRRVGFNPLAEFGVLIRPRPRKTTSSPKALRVALQQSPPSPNLEFVAQKWMRASQIARLRQFIKTL